MRVSLVCFFNKNIAIETHFFIAWTTDGVRKQ